MVSLFTVKRIKLISIWSIKHWNSLTLHKFEHAYSRAWAWTWGQFVIRIPYKTLTLWRCPYCVKRKRMRFTIYMHTCTEGFFECYNTRFLKINILLDFLEKKYANLVLMFKISFPPPPFPSWMVWVRRD